MPFVKERNRKLTYKVGNMQKYKEDMYKIRQKYSGPNPARERQKHKTGRKK